MSYLLYPPTPPLSSYIDCLWHVADQVPYQREKILPMGTVELMINFGAPHRLYHNSNENHFQQMRWSWIAGLQTTYLLNEPTAETNIIGIRFKPGGAYPFLGIPLSELTNHVIDMTLIWGRSIHLIREALCEIPTIYGRFHYLERLLCNRLDQSHQNLPLIQQTTTHIEKTAAPLTIKTLSQEVGISQKHLIHQFKKFVGVSPKQFARISRFQTVLQSINPTQVDWRYLAHHCWYHDQAHFYHDFKAFTGLTPNQYLDLRQAVFGAALKQGEKTHFVPIG